MAPNIIRHAGTLPRGRGDGLVQTKGERIGVEAVCDNVSDVCDNHSEVNASGDDDEAGKEGERGKRKGDLANRE